MTPQQNACLIAIRDLTVDGVSPSFDELAAHLGISSKSGVFRLLESMEERGLIWRMRGHARSIEIIERDGISGDQIAAMSDEALESAVVRMSAALSHRRALSQGMREMAA